MRVRGQSGGNDATSIVFMSALHHKVDCNRYLDQGSTIKLFVDEEITSVCKDAEDFYLYYVKSGAVEVGMRRGSEILSVFYIRSEGDAIIGSRQGFLVFGTSQSIIRAVRNTVLVAFTYQQVIEFMQTDSKFLEDYLYSMHMNMAQMGHRLDTTAHQSSSQRILVWLEKVCEANTPDEDGVYRIPCNLTIDELSGLLLIHYATCNKLLKSLKEKGIVNKTKTHLEIVDNLELRQLFLEENPVLY